MATEISQSRVPSTFGGRLMAERQRLSLTQAELSEAIGCTTSQLIDWEEDRVRQTPDPAVVRALLEVGMCTTYVLFGFRMRCVELPHYRLRLSGALERAR